eukprot:g31818.t1
MTRTEARKNKQKQEEAKAYMGIVIRAFSARQTETHMRRWFGSDAFQTASIRREEGKRQRRREVIYGFCS